MKTDLSANVDARSEIAAQMQSLTVDTDQTRRRLHEIDNVKNARLMSLQKVDPAAYQAVQWIRSNGMLFNQKVYEPVMMEISIENPAFASAVEACISFPIMKTFVCQTREDYDLFTRKLIDEKGLRVNVVELENGKPLEAYRKPISDEQIRSMGFDRYIIDTIEGPDAILRYLCESSHLHTIPMAEEEASVDAEVVEGSRIFQRYIAGKSVSTITYSQYGSRQAQTLTRNVRAARTLVNSVDPTLKRRLDQRIQEIVVKKQELEDESQEITKREKILEKRLEGLKKQLLDLEQEKGSAQQQRSAWEKSMVTLGTKQTALEMERNKPSVEQITQKMIREINKVNSKSQATLMRVMALVQDQMKMRAAIDEATLLQLQHQQKIRTLAALKGQQEEHFKEAQQAFEEVVAAFDEAKRQAVTCQQRAQELVDQASPYLSARFEQLSDEDALPLAELENKMIEEQAKLNMILEVRSGVLEEYNERRHKIEEINEVIRELAQEKEKLDARIRKLEAKWVTALESLVSNVSRRFSEAFRVIGTAGEVKISRDEDYDKWGIDIMVKFRDNAQLQLLTGARQSGGERSISTITYLLSLTEMSRSPFSLVDEINQGMDQKYERQVHDQMVNVTCRQDTGQ